MSTQKKFSVIGCGIVGVFVVLALLFVGGAYQFNQYQDTLAGLADKATPIMIAITDPHTGQEVPAGTPLLVHVSAGSPEALLSLELWVNGQVVGVQAAPAPNGIAPFAADFAWTPSDPGTYTLVARGLQAGNQSADSAGVVVIVGLTQKTVDEAGAGDTGQSVPISNGGGGDGSSIPLPLPPAHPGGSESIGPAQTWSLSLSDWLFGGSDDPPQPPELTAEPEGCGAMIGIHDLSDGEDGFIIFRMTETSPTLTKIATLEGQSELDWLTYTDESYTPANSYMVRAFDGVKVADSNIVFVQGNPADCEQNASGLPLLSIELTSLKADISADMAYCYKSLNGVDWSRWPATDFFMPGADGFDIQSQADSLLLNELEGKSLTLDLECWGWQGGVLKLLGKLHQGDIGAELGVSQLEDGGLAAGLDVGGGIKTFNHTGEKAPTDPKMPKVFAALFFGPDACKEHLPEGFNIIEALHCVWFPEYNQDQGQSQPYLVWYVSDPQYQQCVNGQGAACNNFQYYLNRAALYDGQVGFHVYAQFNNSIPLDTTPHDRTQFVVPPQGACGEDVYFFTVRMFYEGGPNDPDYPDHMIESPDSNTVTSVFNCPPPSEVKLDVFFDTLQIGNLGDGIGGGDDLEIYASMVAEGKNPGGGSVLNLGYWGWSGGDCEDDSFYYYGPETLDPGPVDLDTEGLGVDPECPMVIKEGDVPISDMQLCASNTYSHCVGSYSNNNNKIQITVGDGSQIRIAIHAMDYDENGDDDDVCHTEKLIGPQSIFGWQGFTTSGEMSQGDNGSASCKVFFHVAPSP